MLSEICANAAEHGRSSFGAYAAVQAYHHIVSGPRRRGEEVLIAIADGGPGVRETLESLLELGVRLGIVTSKAARGTAVSLESCAIPAEWFEVVVTAADVPGRSLEPTSPSISTLLAGRFRR